MPHDYDTLVDAINDFKAKGYTEDFNMQSNCIECKAQKYFPIGLTHQDRLF